MPGSNKKSEAVTPLWVCNLQNNLIDAAWFGREVVFNESIGQGWRTVREKIEFPQRPGRAWQDYVRAKRLEVACGEAPYLTSRREVYRNVDIALAERGGMLDRKLRVVAENTETKAAWVKWALESLEAVYGYEIQTSKIERARENLKLTFCENYAAQGFGEPEETLIETVEQILRRNLVVADALAGEIVGLKGVQFEAVVGNPPYHKAGGAGGSNDAPIYQEFARRSFELEAEYVSLVIPARWFAGGRENLLGDFRRYMLQEAGLRNLVVYAEAKNVFDWVNLSGGICVFLAEKGWRGECDYVLVEKGRTERSRRNLGATEVLIREAELVEVVKKVQRKMRAERRPAVATVISGNTPFGITSGLRDAMGREIELFVERNAKHNVELQFFDKPHRVRRYISRKYIKKNREWVAKPKVILPAAGGTGNDRFVIGRTEVMGRNSACSQSYLVAVFDSEHEAENFWRYTRTKFFRALVKARKTSQSAARRVYQFVPLEEFGEASEIEWGRELAEVDRQLYAKYGLGAEEIAYIEERIAYFSEDD